VTEAMDRDARPLQVVRLDMQENCVEVQDENLKIVGDNLRKTGADAVSIVSIMGTYRTGKSFLLDLLMRYLRCWEGSVAAEARQRELRAAAFKKAEWAARITEGKSDEEAVAAGNRAAEEAVKDLLEAPFQPPQSEDWRYKGKRLQPPAWVQRGSVSEAGFEWRGGMAKCTQGIWLWSRPFVLPCEGRRIAVLLMDTQGAWDGMMTKEQNATIFGLTALLASKLICNVQNMLTDDKIDSIDYFTTFAEAACTGFASDGAPFGHLEFLVRDWAWYEAGSSFEDCRDTMQRHLRDMMNSEVEGRKETAERLRQTFRSVGCFGLPHPGLAVLEPAFRGDFEEISSDFSQLLDEFTRSFFRSGGFPKPSTPLGVEISPATFENAIRNFVEAFSDNRGSAVHLREAFVKVELFKHRDLLQEQFRQRLARVAPEGKAVDPDAFAQQEAKMRADFRRDFMAKIHTFKMDDESKQVEDFMAVISQALERRRRENNAELEAAQLKLVASPLVGGGAYFASGHPFLDMAVLTGFGYVQAKKHAAALHTDALDAEVCKHLVADIRGFAEQRLRDLQAMSVAAQRCTPGSTAEQFVVCGKSVAASRAAVSAQRAR